MRFSGFTDRIGGEGAAAWAIHFEAVKAAARGEDVIVLSVGDPDFATPAPIVELSDRYDRNEIRVKSSVSLDWSHTDSMNKVGAFNVGLRSPPHSSLHNQKASRRILVTGPRAS
jgi:hypothetical protein